MKLFEGCRARAQRYTGQPERAVPPAWAEPLVAVLSGAESGRGDLGADATHRRAVAEVPVLQQSADESAFVPGGLFDGAAADAQDESSGNLSEFGGLTARVVKYTIPESDEPSYRLLVTRLDPLQAPAVELAPLHHERWEIESTYDEIKTHLLGRHPILRSKTPPLVRQKIEGLMLAHYAVRHVLHEAAQEADEALDRLSFIHAVHVIRRRVQNPGAFPHAHRPRRLRLAVQNEILEERAESSRSQS